MSPERIKSIRNHMIISSIILLLLGILFIVWPEQAAIFLTRATAIVILGVAAFELVLFFLSKRKGFTDVPAIIIGVILTALGVFLLVRPESLLSFFNIIFGIIILIMGFDHIFQAIFIIRHNRTLWWVSLVVGVAAVVLGIVILVNPFSAVRTAMILVGITMVVEAIGGFWNLPALKARPDAADAKPVNSGDSDINA